MPVLVELFGSVRTRPPPRAARSNIGTCSRECRLARSPHRRSMSHRSVARANLVLSFLDRVRTGERGVLLRDFDQPAVVAVKRHHFLLVETLDVDEPIARAFDRRDQLVELEMDRPRVLVLCA